MLFSCLAIFTKVSRIVQFSHQRVFSKFQIYWFAFVRYVFFSAVLRGVVDSLCVGMGIARRADATFTILRIYYYYWFVLGAVEEDEVRRNRASASASPRGTQRSRQHQHAHCGIREWNNCIDGLQLGLSCRPDSWSPFTKAASNYARILIAKGIT